MMKHGKASRLERERVGVGKQRDCDAFRLISESQNELHKDHEAGFFS